MASPQKSNGNTQIANELLEQFYRVNMSGNEWRVLAWIIRKSYGFNQKNTRYARFSYMVADTDLPESSCRWAIKKLLERNMISQDQNGQYLVQKNYDEWAKEIKQKPQPIAQPIADSGYEKPQPIAEKPQPIAEKPQPIAVAYKELKTLLKTPLKTIGFIPPTAQEVTDYGKSINFNIDGEYFVASYEKVGWVDKNKNKIKSWKACVVTWKKNQARFSAHTPKPQTLAERMAENEAHNAKIMAAIK